MQDDSQAPDFSVEDARPGDDLGGGPDDTVLAPDQDTSSEAYEKLLEDEARFAMGVESAQIPPVRWSADADQPDFAHTFNSATNSLALNEEVEFNFAVYQLLVRANRFQPRGKNGLVCVGLRGGELIGDDAQEEVSDFRIKDTRPNHEAFRCTLGIVDTVNETVSAYRGSTVPNKKWMTNYYKLVHGLPTSSNTKSNLLPTGCYIYRVNAHGGGRIKPALRMTDPDNLTADAKCTVLRTSNDLAYAHDDFWNPSVPYDNIHCAYYNDKFSSAGCQTIKGPNGGGAWGQFQNVIDALGWNARIDYVLVTGREVAIAAAIIAAGRQDDTAFLDACLGRLRVGSEGSEVLALQKKLGFNGTSYFGPSTKKRLTEREGANGLTTDGVYSVADDSATGWSVFETAGMPVENTTQPEVNSNEDGVVNADAVSDASDGSITFRAAAGTQQLDVSTDVTLAHNGRDIPLSVTARVDGIPASGVDVELILRAVTGEAAKPATTESASGVAISPEKFDAYAPRARADYRAKILEDGHAILADHGINENPRRLSHFMAQLYHESGGFSLNEENLNYSAKRLTEVWPNRFPSLTAAQPFANNPEKLANNVYGGRLGNNKPGDGYRYRGRGMIQLTGRDNYAVFSDLLGIDLEGNPDLAFDGAVALRVAAAYWTQRKLKGERSMNALADDDKLRAITYRVNGGFNGFVHREAALDAAKNIWGDITVGATPRIVDRGDFDDDVRRLQILLIEHQRLRGTVDGKFGMGTYRGLFAFKVENRMSGAGYADAATFAKLKEASRPIATEGLLELPEIGNDPEPIRPEIASSYEADWTS
jgi:putative chitinase